ncbi:MAG: hypothetical protein ACJ763_09025 [Bdellovibrionia bacterium]
MRIKTLGFAVLSLAALASCTTEMLSPSGMPITAPTTRPQPPKVDPITIHGKQYGGGFNQGVLPISDAASGKKIKNVTIYSYPDNGEQAVFFKSMKLVNNDQEILIENEVGDKFLFNIKTEKVKPAKTNKVKPTR